MATAEFSKFAGAAAAAKSMQSFPTLCDPIEAAHQIPPSLGFSRQEYWSGLPFPSPGDLPNSGIEPRSPALPACWELGFQAWAQSTCPELSAQGLVPLRFNKPANLEKSAVATGLEKGSFHSNPK